ncbi:hypothetical protein BHM03_00012690 [Ensete ventricosum]|nr:hypothetical protein BHM03_00012690 [Ensete ventricosum]
MLMLRGRTSYLNSASTSRRQATHRVARRQAAHRVARLGPGRSTLFRYTLSGDKLFYIVRQYLMLRATSYFNSASVPNVTRQCV